MESGKGGPRLVSRSRESVNLNEKKKLANMGNCGIINHHPVWEDIKRPNGYTVRGLSSDGQRGSGFFVKGMCPHISHGFPGPSGDALGRFYGGEMGNEIFVNQSICMASGVIVAALGEGGKGRNEK